MLDPGASLGTNAARQMLEPSGRLLDDAQHMLDAFLSDAQVQYSAIEAIAGGERTWNGITKRVGRQGGSMSRALQWLIDMKLIERVVPITERDPDRTRRALYRITDPYVAFWHRFVSPLISAGSIGLASGERLWRDQVKPRLNDYMGDVFESVCRAFVREGTRLPFEPLRVGEWWDGTSQNQIDVVAIGGQGEVLVGECKWGDVQYADLTRLRTRAAMLLNDLGGGAHPLYLALFYGGSATPDLVREAEAGRLLLFSADSLYEETPG
jgi:AAA+ ATPase superfamily predicted ATPase